MVVSAQLRSGDTNTIPLRIALLSRTVGLMVASTLVLVTWCLYMTWLSVQGTGKVWVRSVASGVQSQLDIFGNFYKTRSLRLIVQPDEPILPGEGLIEVSPRGQVTAKAGEISDIQHPFSVLTRDPRQFRRQDFYISDDALFYVVPEMFPEDEGTRRILYVKAIGQDFLERLKKMGGVELLLRINNKTAASTLRNMDGHPLLPSFPGEVVPEKVSLPVPRYRGFENEHEMLLQNVQSLSAFAFPIPVPANNKEQKAELVLLLPEELITRGPREILLGTVGICLAFVCLAVFWLSKTVTTITKPIQNIVGRLQGLSNHIAATVKTSGAVIRPVTNESSGADKDSPIEEMRVLEAAFESLNNEVGRSEHYQSLLKDTQIALQNSNRELEEFAFTVAHDLRAPLRSIDGFSQALLDEYQTKIDEEGKKYLERVNASARRMAKLIEDILTLSRINRAEVNREQVDLSAIAMSVANDLQQREPERKVEFIIEKNLTVEGADRLLQTVLENLLGNSWKFTAKHPAAKIEFGMQERDGEKVYYVRDDGAGFDMSHSEKLFGVFQRLHAVREFSGTGVGLASVKRIIQRHGGRIWAEGEVERGASFYFTLQNRKEQYGPQ